MIYGFTCGAFDLCHAGHMLLFKEARSRCDYLIVGLQEDPSVDNEINLEYRGKLKSPPIMTLEERKTILKGIRYIDSVFTYRGEKELLKKLNELYRKRRFHVRFLGSDYRGRRYTGDEIPHAVFYCDRGHGFSTSSLKERIRKESGV